MPSLHITSTTTPQNLPPLNPLAALDQVATHSPEDFILLHSATPGAGQSVLAYEPLRTFTVPSSHGQPLPALQSAIHDIDFDSPNPLVAWLGFISYDLGATLENIPPFATDELHSPLIHFTLFRHYLLFDSAAPAPTLFTLHEKGELPPDPWKIFGTPLPPRSPPRPGRLISQNSRAEFESKVRRAQEYIAAGDIYQANLAQHWQIETTDFPASIFRKLCENSPAPFAACIRFTDPQYKTPRHILSASPELFLHVNDGHAITRPIKGTRPRDLADAARDEQLREELLNSPKDQAELAMIVDLLRNDLGRVSTFGSVQVTSPRNLEQHPTVWHTVATIESDLRSGVGLAELLAALCPGGSITGAPKIRAMQIIEQLENFRRGIYCGHIGAIGPQAKTIALNIAIRTMLIQENIAHLYAGAGIVADSNPAQEYEETLHKAAAMFRALGIAPPTNSSSSSSSSPSSSSFR